MSNRSRGGSRTGSARRCSKAPDARHPAPAKPPARPGARRGPASRQQEIEQHRPADAVGVMGELGAQLRAFTGNIERKQRPRGDLQRQQLQTRKQVERRAVERRQLAQQPLAGSPDMEGDCRHRARRKTRRGGAALRPPVLARREQQAAVPDRRTQQAPRRRGAAVVVGILDQHVADAGGVAEDDLPTAHKAAGHRQLLEGVRRKGGERVIAQPRGDVAPRLPLAPRIGDGKDGGSIGGCHVSNSLIIDGTTLPLRPWGRRGLG
jgi:hypothetical protein